MKRILLSLALLVFSFFKLSAQGELAVDMYTGTPSIAVPIWSLTSDDITENIALTYDVNATKATAPSGWFGSGWNLQGSSNSVSREVRSLPDDFGYNDTRKGLALQ